VYVICDSIYKVYKKNKSTKSLQTLLFILRWSPTMFPRPMNEIHAFLRRFTCKTLHCVLIVPIVTCIW